MGYAEISILDAEDNVISTNSILLEKNCTYANIDTPDDGTVNGEYQPATISLTYPEKAEKAAKIQIIFKSSQLISSELEKRKNESNMRPPRSNDLSNDLYLGSTHFIDDIKLNY